MNLEFKDSEGNRVDLKKEILNYVNSDHQYEIFLGTDSQLHRDQYRVVYATVVVIYKKGKGGRYFLCKQSGQVLNSLRERLIRETWVSIELAFDILEFLPKNVELQIHIDSNGSRKFKSGNYTEELIGMVTSQGIKCRIKPEAWAAQSVADRFSK